MSVLGGAWTAHVIWYLRADERCFSELQADIAGISAKMLTSRLRMLEREGVVERFTKPTSPPTVWYSLTPAGKDLSAALINLIDVAQRVKPKISSSAKGLHRDTAVTTRPTSASK